MSKNVKESKDKLKPLKSKYYREFLSQLGIDPEDFDEDLNYEIEIDDYAK